MEKITIGLIPSPDLSENLINKITDKLKVNFEKKIDSNIDWQFEVKVKVFVGAAEYVNETINKVIKVKEESNWDYVISITDLPSFSAHKVVMADISTENGVGLISLPSFGAFPLKRRIIKALTYIGEILYKNHQKKVEEITQDMKWNFLFSNVKRVTPEEATNTNIRFVLQNRIIGWLRVLTGMVFANRPWQAIGSFKKVLTLSFATGTYISIFSTPWQLSVAYTPSRFILLMLLSMTGMVVWINIAHNLWEKKSSKSQSQYRILYNVTTIMTLVVITVINYAVLLSLFTLSISLFVPEGIFDAATDEGATSQVESYLRLAWLTASLALLVGAVGATIEKEEVIRSATYSYRQRNRYYEIEKQEESDKQADEESYSGTQQTHKEQDES
ncbi:MAG TPA: hypothetical protein VK094_07935 [Pseudogracilibacillus sp.]|nr:hypothetical protein [Pseudogracilibacillus sp.]